MGNQNVTEATIASPVLQTCGPQNVFGPYEQTLFLGLSIMSFNVTVGWNEQVSQLTVQLVEDDCEAPAYAPKVYWDENLEQQTTTAADPGFLGTSNDIIGAPAYFRVADFEFSGIIQSWTQTNSTGGKPTYEVILVDPRQVLEGCQVLLNEYAGSVASLVGSPYNIFNAYGFLEQFGSTCPQFSYNGSTYVAGNSGPDGAIFGTPAGGFGGSLVNDNGLPWNSLRGALNVLCNAVPANSSVFSPYGRIHFKGPETSGYGLLAHDVSSAFAFDNHSGNLAQYFLDISELPTLPSYWRVKGASISILELINQIANETGHDYYIELLPTKVGSNILKLIKVRTVARRGQPNLNQISSFINSTQVGTIQNSQGRELRNEPTASFLIGGKKKVIYQIPFLSDPEGDGDEGTNDDSIIPYFGKDTLGNVIIPSKDSDDNWEFDAETTLLNASLGTEYTDSTIKINELELQYAQEGFDEWLIYAIETETDSIDKWPGNISGGGGLRINPTIEALKAKKGHLFGQDVAASQLFVLEDGQADIKTIYEFIASFAKDNYGRTFQVRVPFTCVRTDGESGEAELSEQPTDAGWTEQTDILGVPHPSSFTELFSIDDGRLGAFCRINIDSLEDGEFPDLNQFGFDEYFSFSNKLFIKCSVEPEYVYTDRTTFSNPRAIITITQPIHKKIEDKGFGIHGLKKLFELLDPGGTLDDTTAEDIRKRLNGVMTEFKRGYQALDVDGAAIPLESNISTYGPWVTPGPAGAARILHDDGLTPWNFGSTAGLNVAAAGLAAEGLTAMQIGENGNVSVPGYPTLPLGSELGALNGGAFGGGVHLIENRSISSENFSEDTSVSFRFVDFPNKWTGLFGPNITNINVQNNPQGVQTTYTLRTFTPKYGVLAKYNAERIKNATEARNLIRRRSQELPSNLELLNRKIAVAERRERTRNQLGDSWKTPHNLLMGQMVEITGDNKRTIVSSLSSLEVGRENRNDYDSKGLMSLDGLVRPISMDGDGSLPRYSDFAPICHSGGPRYSQPIVNGNKYNLIIDQDYLNPFTNTNNQAARKKLQDRHDGTKTRSGHDIDVVGRGTGVGSGSIVMGIEGYSSDIRDADYQDDYRFLGLRGPLIIHGWGYDLDGKPIPNAADTFSDTESGVFTEANLEDKFLDDWLRKPTSWPVGPLDVRWDRERGCWVSSAGYRFIRGTASGDIGPNETGTIKDFDLPSWLTLYDEDGNSFTPNTDSAVNWSNGTISSGDKVVALYEPDNCQYYIVNGPSSGLTMTGICSKDCFEDADDSTGSYSKFEFGAFLACTGNGDTLQISSFGGYKNHSGESFNAEFLEFDESFKLSNQGSEDNCITTLVELTGARITGICSTDCFTDDEEGTGSYNKFNFGAFLACNDDGDTLNISSFGGYKNKNDSTFNAEYLKFDSNFTVTSEGSEDNCETTLVGFTGRPPISITSSELCYNDEGDTTADYTSLEFGHGIETSGDGSQLNISSFTHLRDANDLDYETDVVKFGSGFSIIISGNDNNCSETLINFSQTGTVSGIATDFCYENNENISGSFNKFEFGANLNTSGMGDTLGISAYTSLRDSEDTFLPAEVVKFGSGFSLSTSGDACDTVTVGYTGNISVDADDCWIGLTGENQIIHLRPHDNSGYADCSVTHNLEIDCYIQLDDAGHVMGVHNLANGWESPWGFSDPGFP